MANNARVQRVSDEIQKVIQSLLNTKIRDPRLKWVSVTSVEVSRDLSAAKVYFSSMNQDNAVQEIIKAFEASKGFFRTALAKSLSLRITPALRFIHDDSLNYGHKMDELISKARSKDQEVIAVEESEENNSSSKRDEDNDDEKRERLR